MSIDVRFKSNTIVEPKAETLENEEVKNETVIDDVDLENETWGIEDPFNEEVPSNPFDAYMMGDTVGLKAVTASDGIMAAPEDIIPSWEDIKAADDRALSYPDVALQRYLEVKADLEALRKQLVLVQLEASESPEVLEEVTEKIQKIDILLPWVEVQAQAVQADCEMLDNNSYKEFRDGIDYDGNGLIGRGPNALGVKILANGQRIFLNPTTGAVIDRPPLSMPQYDVQVARGNVNLIANEELPDAPTADLTLQLKDPASGDFDENFESKFNTSYEMMNMEYVWVLRDSPEDFTPKKDFRDKDFETHYTPAAFEQGADGVIRQTKPTDLSRYVQVRVAKVVGFSEPNVHGGFDHHFKFIDQDENTIMCVRVTGFSGDPSMPWTDANGYAAASNFGLSFNMDHSFSNMLVDFADIESTNFHRVADLESSLDIPDSGSVLPDQGGSAYSDNIALFEEENPTTHSWDIDAETSTQLQRDAGDMPAFGSGWMYDAYMSQEDAESGMADLAADQTTAVKARENFRTLNTGVFVHGQGAFGHFIGTRFNDVFEIADVNAVMNDEEYTNAFPYLDPIQRDSDSYISVVEAGMGNNTLVHKGGGDIYANGITFAWVDANRDDTVHITCQGADNPAVDMDSEGDVETIPINYRTYIHVDAPSGDVQIGNPLEESGTLVAHSSEEAHQQEEDQEAPVQQSYIDDYYDIQGGRNNVRFAHIDDPDVIRSVGQLDNPNQGSLTGMSDTLYEMTELIWDDITRVEMPDNADALAEEWKAKYGYASAEMQAEMDGFFNTMFGMKDSFLAELNMVAMQSTV